MLQFSGMALLSPRRPYAPFGSHEPERVANDAGVPLLSPAAATGLLACARARTDFSWLQLLDPAAERLLREFPELCRRFPDERLVLASALRASAIDQLAIAFADRFPNGTGASPFSGLSTRALRLSSYLPWRDIDEPEIAIFKKQVWPDCSGFQLRQARGSNTGWCRGLLHGSAPLFVVLDEAWVSADDCHWADALNSLSWQLPSNSEIIAIRPSSSPLGRTPFGPSTELPELKGQRFPNLRHATLAHLPPVAQRYLTLNQSLGHFGAPQVELLRIA